MRNIAREGVSDGRGNNCIYSWAFDRKMGKSVTVSEVKFVTAHEVINKNGFYYVGFNINGYVNVDCRICSSINAAGVIVGSDDKTLIGYFAGTMSAIVKLNQGDKIIATVYSSATYSGSTRIYFFNVIKL